MQNFFVINAVVSTTYFACLAWKCLLKPQNFDIKDFDPLNIVNTTKCTINY